MGMRRLREGASWEKCDFHGSEGVGAAAWARRGVRRHEAAAVGASAGEEGSFSFGTDGEKGFQGAGERHGVFYHVSGVTLYMAGQSRSHV